MPAFETERASRRFHGAAPVLLFFLAVPAVYFLFSRPLIEAAYHGRVPQFLNGLIQSQQTHPLEYYFETADSLFKRFYAIFAAAALFLFLFWRWCKTLTWRRLLAALLILLTGEGVLFAYHLLQMNLFEFQKAEKRFLQKNRELEQRAREFSPEQALRSLGQNPLNGFYYRLDEKWKEAALPEKNWNLPDGVYPVPFRKDKGRFVIENAAPPRPPFDGRIGEIEIRMRVKTARKMELYWTGKTPDARFSVIPGETFHTYSVKVDGQSLGHEFWLKSESPADEEAEVEFFHLLTRKAKYAKAPVGTAYEFLGGEMQKALYFNTPAEISYSLALPLEKTRLSFGAGVLENDDPVTFDVFLREAEGETRIFSQVLQKNEGWKEHRVDLSPWAGKQIQITLKASSAHGNIAFWGHPLISGAPAKKMNVIMILEDALGAEHLPYYGYERMTAPFKMALSEKGVIFEKAFAQSLVTRSSCASLMTSLYATAAGVWNAADSLHDSFLTLAEVMSSQGFAAASFVQNENGGPATGLHQGFDHLFTQKTGKRPQEIFGQPLREWLETHADRNFFLYLHLIDPHGPYDPPPPYDQKFSGSFSSAGAGGKAQKNAWSQNAARETQRRIALYDGEIRNNDDALREFWKWLEEKGLVENTLFVFLADHGEYFGEHGFWGHGQSAGYKTLIHVPLVLYYPAAIRGPVKIKAPVQLVDLMPTLLDFAGIDRKPLLFQGDSLTSLLRGEEASFWNHRFVLSEELDVKDKKDKNGWGSLLFGRWHFLGSAYRRTSKIFDFEKDPKENRDWNSFAFDPLLRFRLGSVIRRVQRSGEEIRSALTQRSENKIISDPQVQERLRSLGYLN